MARELRAKTYVFAMMIILVIQASGCTGKTALSSDNDTVDLLTPGDSFHEKNEAFLIIRTDKTKYHPDDRMEIIISNDGIDSVYIDMDEYSYSDEIYRIILEKYENSSWNKYRDLPERIKCRPGGQGPAIGCVEIRGGSTLERIKSLSYQGCVGEYPDSVEKEYPLPEGTYRLKIAVKAKCSYSEPSESILSNEFSIEKASDEQVSLSADKLEYDKGEIVTGMFKFSGDIYIDPYFKIYSFENESWNYLGMWSFDGNQYTCCGAIPSCELSNAAASPVEIKWDQNVAKEPLPIQPGTNITKKQVDLGKYKIRIVYGKQRVCTEGIDVEFLIT